MTSGSNIYIICEAADQQEGRVVRDALKTAHHAILPRFSGEPREICLEHEEYLKEANAVLVLWPRGDNPGWLRMKVREVSKALGLGRTAPFLAKAVLTPPTTRISCTPDSSTRSRLSRTSCLFSTGPGCGRVIAAARSPRKPYPGLRPFKKEETDLFFGREGQSDELLVRLWKHRLLAVVGTSGSGKIFAGEGRSAPS